MHWSTKYHLQEIIGAALIERGWNGHDYRPRTTDDYGETVTEARWSGLATHPDLSGVVIVVLAQDFDLITQDHVGAIITLDQLSREAPALPAYTPLKPGTSWHVENADGVIASGGIPSYAQGRDDELATFVDRLIAAACKERPAKRPSKTTLPTLRKQAVNALGDLFEVVKLEGPRYRGDYYRAWLNVTGLHIHVEMLQYLTEARQRLTSAGVSVVEDYEDFVFVRRRNGKRCAVVLIKYA